MIWIILYCLQSIPASYFIAQVIGSTKEPRPPFGSPSASKE